MNNFSIITLNQSEGSTTTEISGGSATQVLDIGKSTKSKTNKNEISKSQYECRIEGCGKLFTSASAVNNHMKRKHLAKSFYPCDECSSNFTIQHERTLHKIKEHEGRRFQISRFQTKKDNSEYPCPECSKVFYTLDMFAEHRILHDSTIIKYTCKDCGKEFISEKKLKDHSIVHQERTMYKCNVCAKVFLRSQTLQYHRLICKAAYPCGECVDSFMTEEALVKHKVFHAAANFTCKKCNKVFPDQETLAVHEKRHSLRMNYTCQICKETISTQAKFQKHIKDHLEVNLECQICKEKFQSLVKYGYHKAEMHSIMRPYDCVLCSDTFCTRNELFLHLHNHIDMNTSTNMYQCENCDIKFSLKENYEKHRDSHRKDEPVTLTPPQPIAEQDHKNSNFSCDQCDKTFNYKSLLSHHKIAEHGLFSYPCTVGFCDQIFTTPELCNEHMQQHEIDSNLEDDSQDTLPFKCKIEGCKRSFEYASRLNKHMTSHVLEEYKCSKCDRIFYSQSIFEHHYNLCECSNSNHVGPVKCNICRQLFENPTVLQNHRKFCWENSSTLSEDKSILSNDDSIQSVRSIENLRSPESILSVYVQNDYDSNLLPEL